MLSISERHANGNSGWFLQPVLAGDRSRNRRFPKPAIFRRGEWAIVRFAKAFCVHADVQRSPPVQQRLRDVISGPLTFDYFQERLRAGWVPVAMEWMMPVSPDTAGAEEAVEQVETPYGFRVGGSSKALEPDPEEIDVLYVILEQIVRDKRFTQIADELNRRHFKQRAGTAWTSSAVFELLPHLIEAGPALVKSDEWAGRRQDIVARQQSS
jgi:hypothetical protein